MLFQDHLIVIQSGLNARIEKYLQEKNLHYINKVVLPKQTTKNTTVRKVLEAEIEVEKEKHLYSQQEAAKKLAVLNDKLENNFTVLDQMIRSGRELNIEGDLLLLNRVNSAATINVSGNFIITKIVEGMIRCKGKFMMLSASSKANIQFHGIEVNTDLLKDRLNRVELRNEKVVVTPVFKKEKSWVQ